MLYFAYGSNLHLEQMQKRCPDSTPVARVKLPGFRLCFNRVADVVEDEQALVWGALYRITRADLENLDHYEGYPYHYDRVPVEVIDDEGQAHGAFAYVLNTKGREKPGIGYYQIIEEGYRNWELPLKALQQADMAPSAPLAATAPRLGRK